ncbi:MAG: ABC transporter substrate-binding protein, partial [Pseudomonadota bacterium]
MSLYSKLFCEAEKAGAAARRAAAAAVIASLASLAAPQPAPAQTAEAMGLEGAPIRITAAIRSRPDRCYFDGADVAMRRLAEQETARINAAGGIWGRPLELRLIADAPIRETRGDDAAAREALYAGVRETLEDPDALAMVGLSSSSNGEVLFNEFAEPFAATDLPILTDISVASVFAGAPTAFSTRPGQEAERGPTLAAFLRARDFKRVAVIYRGDAIWSETLATAVMGGLEPERVVGAHALERGPDRKIDPARMAETAAAVRAARPNAVMISIGTRDTKAMIDALGEDFRGAVIVSGNLERIAGEVDRSYPNPIYGLASSRLPEIDNERLRRLVGGVGSTEWIFEGARNPDASGWARGDCEERAEIDPRFRDPLDRANQRAIERAATMADMIALAADAAISAGPSADMAARRAAVRAASTPRRRAGSATASASGGSMRAATSIARSKAARTAS